MIIEENQPCVWLELLAGTVTAKNLLLAETVPANKLLLAGTVPANTLSSLRLKRTEMGQNFLFVNVFLQTYPFLRNFSAILTLNFLIGAHKSGLLFQILQREGGGESF